MSPSPSLNKVACGVCLAAVVSLHTSAAFAQPQADPVTLQRLREELAERDAVIIELLERVRALERARTPGEGDAAPASREARADGGDPRDASAGARAAARSGPGLEVDELQAERALERGLVQDGARLLAPGSIELAPGLTASREEGMFPTALMVGDDSIVGEVERTSEVFDRRADLRIGLPLDLQLEIGIPYRVVDQRMETGIDGAVQSASEQSGAGFADATVGLAKVLAAEQSWRPNLVGRLVWLTGSGEERDGGVYLGGGNPGAAAQLSAYWRRDPVVFVIGGGYTHYADESTIRRGDSVDLSLGLGLAISPETAVTISLDQSFIEEFERDGVELAGSDRVSSTLGLSASTILGRRLFLRADACVGLTDDAPDYRFGVSLSSRFGAR